MNLAIFGLFFKSLNQIPSRPSEARPSACGNPEIMGVRKGRADRLSEA